MASCWKRLQPSLHWPAGGVIDPAATQDREEADECRKMHAIIEQHGMQRCFRWIVAQVRCAAATAAR